MLGGGKKKKEQDAKKAAARAASKKNAKLGGKINAKEAQRLKCRSCAKLGEGGYCGRHSGLSRLHAHENYNVSADDPDFLDKI